MIMFKYLSARLKLLKTPLIASLVLLSVVCLLFGVVLQFRDNIDEKNNQKIKVGICGNVDNKLLKFGIEFLENADEAKEYLDIVILDSEKAAYTAVEDGTVSGCVIFSEEFLSSVTKGKNTPLTYITKKSTVDISAGVVNEILETVSVMVVDVQSAAFTSEEYLKSFDGYKEKKLWSKINTFLINKVLNRDKTVEVVLTGDNAITLEGYYFSSVMVLSLLFCGLIFSPYIVGNKRSLYKLLDSKDCGAVKQVLAENLSYVLSQIVLFVFLSVVFYFVVDNMTLGVREIESLGFRGFVTFFAKAFPALVIISVMQNFLCGMCNDIVSGISLLFSVSMGVAYLSGCFYPSSFFPQGLVHIMNKLPVGSAFMYIQNIMIGKSTVEELLYIILLTVAMLLCQILVRIAVMKAGER